jgi:hypothetical protein
MGKHYEHKYSIIFRGSINICKIDYEKGTCATIAPKTQNPNNVP